MAGITGGGFWEATTLRLVYILKTRHHAVKPVFNRWRCGVAQLSERLIRDRSVSSSNPSKAQACCFLAQETLPLLHSNGWFHKPIHSAINIIMQIKRLFQMSEVQPTLTWFS